MQTVEYKALSVESVLGNGLSVPCQLEAAEEVRRCLVLTAPGMGHAEGFVKRQSSLQSNTE